MYATRSDETGCGFEKEQREVRGRVCREEGKEKNAMIIF